VSVLHESIVQVQVGWLDGHIVVFAKGGPVAAKRERWSDDQKGAGPRSSDPTKALKIRFATRRIRDIQAHLQVRNIDPQLKGRSGNDPSEGPRTQLVLDQAPILSAVACSVRQDGSVLDQRFDFGACPFIGVLKRQPLHTLARIQKSDEATFPPVGE